MQRLSGSPLLALVLVANAFAAWRSGKRLWSLMRRSRFLFLAVVILYSFFTPGTRLWMDLPLPAPTFEGLALALEHAARLAGVLALVCALVVSYAHEMLVGGMLVCLTPLQKLHVPIERAALRMAIVLEMVSAPQGLPSWRQALSSVHDGNGAPTPVVVHLPAWSGVDVFIVLALIAAAEVLVRVCR
ncbi:hypothetical protein [Niveibacterium sp.]|uniref:hypothetical protein n=1 Tax=Niveibacterium sp. TaxID=2017444 RepID=UPI0035AF39DA